MAYPMSIGAALCLLMALFAQVCVQTSAQARPRPWSTMDGPETPLAPPTYTPEMTPMTPSPAYAPEMSPMESPMLAPGHSMTTAPGPAPMMSSASTNVLSGVALFMGFAALFLC